MFRWEEISGFYLLMLIPSVVILWWWSRKRTRDLREKTIHPNLLDRLVPFKVNEVQQISLLVAMLTLIVLAYVNPQSGLKKEKQSVEKSDIIIALDISNSMNAKDISPSRLEKSKRFISDFIRTRKGDQVGLIYFAGSAFLQIPLTTDVSAVEMFARAANTNMAGTQGTNIGEAIDLALKSVQEPHQRALILISDGEDHDDKALGMAAKAKEAGWNVFTIAVGTDAGSMVPIAEDGHEAYIYDDQGNPVISIVNIDLLKDLASKGGGAFYRLTDDHRSVISDLNVRLDKLQKHAREVQSYTEYKSYYQYLLFPAMVLMLIGFFYDFKIK